MSAALRPIVNLSRETVVCETTTIADKALRRMRGLLGRASLAAGEGMLLMPAPSIHTAFMRFPIDVVFTDRQMRVIRIEAELPPWRAASARHASNVLELAAGEAARRGVEVGDQLAIGAAERTYQDAQDRPTGVKIRVSPADDAIAAWTSGNGDAAQLGRDAANLSDTGIRVLLIAHDRRFRAVATTLLERRGLSVAVGERTVLSEPAALQGTDVVVLDAGNSVTPAAEDAAAIAAIAPSVGVVIVAERPLLGLSSLPVLPKWGSFDGLISAIEHAEPQIGVPDDVRG